MEDVFGKGLDLNRGQEPFGIEDETPLGILDLEVSGSLNSGSGGGVSLGQENDNVNTFLPQVEEKEVAGKTPGAVEGSGVSLMGYKLGDDCILGPVKPSDLQYRPLVESGRAVVHRPKGMLCADLNEIIVETPENPVPIEVSEPTEAGIAVPVVGTAMADDLIETTDHRLDENHGEGALQTTIYNQFGDVQAGGISEATCFVDQGVSHGSIIDVQETGLGSTEPMIASVTGASCSVDVQFAGNESGIAAETGNSTQACPSVSTAVERQVLGTPTDKADQQHSFETELTNLAVRNHQSSTVGNSRVMPTDRSDLEGVSGLQEEVKPLEDPSGLQGDVNPMECPSDPQGRVNSLEAPSNLEGNVNPIEDPSGLLEKDSSMDGPCDLQGRVSMEGPSSLLDKAISMEGPFDLQGRVNPMEDQFYLQIGMERHTEGSVSAQDATNFKSDESSIAPPDAEVCGQNCLPEEHGLSVGDLVWGKVKYHPWWPGQIFDPLDSSDLARKSRKKDRLLVAYFGDQTFAWCEESQLRPFQQKFAELSKQTTAKAFCNAVDNALDELARRVKYGLACSCLSERTHSMLTCKPTVNSGIHEAAVVSDHRDISRAVTTFEPQKLLAYIRNLAKSPFTSDVLESTLVCAQVCAFSAAERILVHGKTSAETPFKHRVASEGKPFLKSPAYHQDGQAFGVIESGIKRMKSSVSNSGKRRQSSDRKELWKNKKRRTGGLFAGGEVSDGGGNDMTENDEALLEISGSKFFKKMTGTPRRLKLEEGEELSARKRSLSTSKKQKTPESIFSSGEHKNGSKGKQGKNYVNYASPRAGDGKSMKTPKVFKLGECISKIASQLTGSPPIIRRMDHPVWKSSPQHGGKKATVKSKKKNLTSPSNKLKSTLVITEDCSIKQLLAEFSFLAQNPTYCPEEKNNLSRVTSVFLEFRDAVFQKGHGYPSYRKPASLKLANRTPKRKSSKSSSDLTGSLSMDDLKDLDWTDKTVASKPRHRQVQSTLKRKGEVKVEDDKKQQKRRIKSASPSWPNKALKQKLEDEAVDCGVSGPLERSMVPNLPVVNEMGSPEESNADQSPTAVFMRFPPGFDVPSETELKEKFAPYGPLETSETKAFRDSGCAQVVFKRCSDAEAAFNTATVNSVFGSVTVSFRLRYLSSRTKTDTPQIADHGKDKESMLNVARHSSLLENTSRNVDELKGNAVQSFASEAPSTENIGTTRLNPSGEVPPIFHHQNPEMMTSVPSPSAERTSTSVTSKVDNVAPGSKSNIVDAMMGLLQKVSTLVGSPN